MKISVIGNGRVGKSVKEMLGVYDVVTDEFKADIGIVCVPTPSKEDGSCDSSIVQEVVEKLDAGLIVIKSTVAPGTTDALIEKTGKNIIFFPEYVGESSYWNPYFNDDMKEVPFVILGGSKSLTGKFVDVLLPVLGPLKTYFQTTAKNAEMAKYMENAFFATKITFVNEMNKICNELGADWHEVREAWLLDPRVNKMHTAVFKGYGGKCLPKDMKAIVRASEEVGYTPKFLKEVIESNERFV